MSRTGGITRARPHDIIPPVSSLRLLGTRVEAAIVTRHLQYPYEQKAKHWLSVEEEIMLISMGRSARFGMGEGAPF
jgi:hypothetical protein